MNAGVIVFALERRYLEARIRCDEARWLALWPESWMWRRSGGGWVAFERVAAGDQAGGRLRV